MLQEACDGNGKIELNRVSNFASVVQCHAASDPNERDGISVNELLTPAMCIGVSGEAWAN